MNAGKVLLPLPPEVPPTTAIRSTTLIASLATLRDLQVADAYFAALPRSYHDTMAHLIAGQWTPIDVGMAHYAAVETLGLPQEQARANGRRVAERVQNSYFATLVRALGAGISPLSVLPRLPSFLARLVNGGACAVYRTGRRDARVEIHGVPLVRFAYVRLGWAGMFEGTLELISPRVSVRDASRTVATTVAELEVSWV